MREGTKLTTRETAVLTAVAAHANPPAYMHRAVERCTRYGLIAQYEVSDAWVWRLTPKGERALKEGAL
jgi:hypothetical protein